MSGSPAETTQEITQKTHTQFQDKCEKYLILSGKEPEPPEWKAGTLPTTPQRQTRYILEGNFISKECEYYLRSVLTV